MRRIAGTVSLLLVVGLSLALMMPGDAAAQMCVKYTRSLTNFEIYGDAWTWWGKAGGRYARGSRPTVGSVMVFRRRPFLPYGHVSTVSALVDRRTVLVDHSWVRGQGLVRRQRVVDVSRANDWSRVRVWHKPTRQLGTTVYPLYGFIYPRPTGNRAAAVETAAVSRRPARRSTAPRPTVAPITPAEKPLVLANLPVPTVKPMAALVDGYAPGPYSVAPASRRATDGAVDQSAAAPTGSDAPEPSPVALAAAVYIEGIEIAVLRAAPRGRARPGDAPDREVAVLAPGPTEDAPPLPAVRPQSREGVTARPVVVPRNKPVTTVVPVAKPATAVSPADERAETARLTPRAGTRPASRGRLPFDDTLALVAEVPLEIR